jgi:hypothetical protein
MIRSVDIRVYTKGLPIEPQRIIEPAVLLVLNRFTVHFNCGAKGGARR